MLCTGSQDYSTNCSDCCTLKKTLQIKSGIFKVIYSKDFGTSPAHSELRKRAANSPEHHPLLGINQPRACNYTDFLSSNICSVNCVSRSTAQLLPHSQPPKPYYAAPGVLPYQEGALFEDIKNPCPGYATEQASLIHTYTANAQQSYELLTLTQEYSDQERMCP